MNYRKQILFVVVSLIGIASIYFFASTIERKIPSTSILLDKNNQKMLHLTYINLHNVYNMGGYLDIVNYVYVRTGGCKVKIPNTSDIKTLKFHLNSSSYAEKNNQTVDFSAKITVAGDFLSSTPRKIALKMISDRLNEAYLKAMECYRKKLDRETLLDSGSL